MYRFALTLLSLCLAAMSVSAQKADIEVSYTKRSFYQNGKEKINTYHLLANTRQSKFFNPHSEEIDSLTSTPEGLAQFKKIQQASLQAMLSQGVITVDKLPRKKETDYVVKSASDSLLTVYDMLLDEPVYYTEPFDELSWVIGDSTRTILGYECISAETDYHGRHWTAWFTPEIPVHDGPWKLRGLPGLILEATYKDGVGFFADGIEQTDKTITGIYGADKYEKYSRKDILRARRAIRDNPKGVLSAKGFLEGVEFKSDQPELKSNTSDFIETDYH